MYALLRTYKGGLILLEGDFDKPEKMRAISVFKMPKASNKHYRSFVHGSNQIIAKSENREELIAMATLEAL